MGFSLVADSIESDKQAKQRLLDQFLEEKHPKTKQTKTRPTSLGWDSNCIFNLPCRRHDLSPKVYWGGTQQMFFSTKESDLNQAGQHGVLGNCFLLVTRQRGGKILRPLNPEHHLVLKEWG